MMTDIGSTEATADSDLSTHMSARMSARTPCIEVITRGERRRRWSAEEKQAIVAESLESNVSIAGIARKHGIGTGQLYCWRHQFLVSRPGKTASFARVELVHEPRPLAGPISVSSGMIEIVLPGGATIRVDAQVDEQALRRVLGVLRGPAWAKPELRSGEGR
jgi:transposase